MVVAGDVGAKKSYWCLWCLATAVLCECAHAVRRWC